MATLKVYRLPEDKAAYDRDRLRYRKRLTHRPEWMHTSRGIVAILRIGAPRYTGVPLRPLHIQTTGDPA